MMINGTVKAVSAKEFKGNPTFAFVLREDESRWYNVDLDKDSKVNKGDSVSFEMVERGKSAYATGIKSAAGLAETQARPNGYRKPFRADVGGKDEYWKSREERDIVTQSVIQLQASRNSALNAADLLLKNNAVALPKKQADIMDAILALVDDVTQRFEVQSTNRRLGKTESTVGEVAEAVLPKTVEKEEEWS